MDEDMVGPAPNGWSGLRAIAALHGLNTRCFAMLAKAAQREKAAECSEIFHEGMFWRRVDPRACERAGRCPVLLVNLNFENLAWWKRVRGAASAVPRPIGRLALLQEDDARRLLREILMDAWRLASASPREASLLFGMTPGVTVEIRNLSALDIDRVAADYTGDLRPRWEENRVFWRNLLEAALGLDDEALFKVHLHCLQLLGGEF